MLLLTDISCEKAIHPDSTFLSWSGCLALEKNVGVVVFLFELDVFLPVESEQAGRSSGTSLQRSSFVASMAVPTGLDPSVFDLPGFSQRLLNSGYHKVVPLGLDVVVGS